MKLQPADEAHAVSERHDRRQAESQQELTKQVLAVLNRDTEIDQLIGDILRLIKAQAGTDSVGIRLREEDDFPYYEADGFPGGFLKAERHLCALDSAGELSRDSEGNPVLECLCGHVLCGRTDPAKPFFTPKGSFWTNSTSAFIASKPELDLQGHLRNRCNSEGYESVALIPLRSGSEVIGLLQLNDRRSGMFTLKKVSFFEEIGASIGIALSRQRAFAALKESEERYRSLYVESRDAIMTISPEWGFLSGNPAAIKLFACRDEKDFTGRAPASLSPERQPDGESSSDKFQVMMRMAFEKGSHFFEWTHRRADGTDFPATVLLSRLDSGGQQLLQATVRDMTEQRRLQDQFRQAQKMEAIGRLAGGVAHDFNNQLMGIMGYAELCREQIGPGHPIGEWIDEITRIVQRSAEITRQLLTFARKQTSDPKITNLNDVVADILKLLRRLIGEGVRLDWLPGADLRAVRVDSAQVDQILANLCLNARDAISDSGAITLETGNIVIDSDDCVKYADACPGAYVFLSVSDNGIGMSLETQSHIFEPFFTTKGVGKGTGLGLSAVYGIVKQNSGFIDVNSTLGKGTSIKICLPQVEAEAAKETATGAEETPKGHGETILLVEDDKTLRATCRLLLESLSYKVLSPETPEAAVKLFTQNPGAIHLVLTDVVMPGMDGRQLADRVSEVKPDAKVLFMSGYTADVIADHGVLKLNTAFIAKPFTRDNLARKVRALLKPNDCRCEDKERAQAAAALDSRIRRVS